MQAIYATTAQLPGMPLLMACDRIHAGVDEVFGRIDPGHIQLCPQTTDFLDERRIDQLKKRFPSTQFRPHANIRTRPGPIHVFDASTHGPEADAYFIRLGRLSEQLGAPLYSLHAGRRSESSLDQLKERVAWIQDQFPCVVAVEGLYPTPQKTWLVQDWTEYRWLLESGLPYALDLSHLNILVNQLGKPDMGFVCALISNPQCRELHISDNDGRADSHWILREPPWWWALLRDTPTTALCFTEGRQDLGKKYHGFYEPRPESDRSGQKLSEP